MRLCGRSLLPLSVAAHRCPADRPLNCAAKAFQRGGWLNSQVCCHILRNQGLESHNTACPRLPLTGPRDGCQQGVFVAIVATGSAMHSSHFYKVVHWICSLSSAQLSLFEHAWCPALYKERGTVVDAQMAAMQLDDAPSGRRRAATQVIHTYSIDQLPSWLAPPNWLAPAQPPACEACSTASGTGCAAVMEYWPGSSRQD